MIATRFIWDRPAVVFLKRLVEHRTPTSHHALENMKSSFAKHLVNENHGYTDFKTNLVPLHICNKGQYMNALEEFEIYKAYNNSDTRPFVLNNQLNFKSNALYDTALRQLSGDE